ncbi:MAG: (2Fe-2S)-binding protein [Anaerolineaceae bacterium]
MEKITSQRTVNQKAVQVVTVPNRTLLEVLREDLALTGVKNGCAEGECGACSIFMNGELVNSCLVLIGQAQGANILTIEGLAEDGRLHPVQQAFIDAGAVQCGFCTPGMVMTTVDLLDHNPLPSEDQIRTAFAGNLCRCTGYVQIFDAVKRAAEERSHA